MARTSTNAGLSTEDIEALRSTVAAGQRANVVFTDSAGQIAGKTGQVVRLGDPAQSDEWIVVRFGNDELPFSPADVRLRGRAVRKAAQPAEQPAPATKAPVKKTSAKTAPARTAPAKAVPVRKGKPPVSLSVTLAWQDGVWTVQASRGSRVIVKATPVRAADAQKMAAMLDEPAVRSAVDEIVEAARAEAAGEADRLRQQLAQAEARLAELSSG